MFSRMGSLAALVLGVALPCSLVWADDPPPGEKQEQEKKEVQKEQRDREEEQGVRQRGPRGAMGRFDGQAFVQRLTDELALTEEQQAAIKDIVDKQMASMRENVNADPAEADKQRELREQMAEAREAGDREKMQELGEKLREANAARREQFEKMRAQMDEKIVTVLTPEQKKKYEEFQANMRGGRGERGANNPRLVREAVMRLDLSADQKSKIEAIFEKAKDATKDLKRDDREGRMAVNKKIHDDVVAQLTEEQAEQFKRNLARAERGGPGGERFNRRRGGGDDGA